MTKKLYKNNKKFIPVKNGYNLFLFLTEPLKVKILLTWVKKTGVITCLF